MNRSEIRIIMGVGFIMSVKDLIGSLYISLRAHSLITVLVAAVFFILFYEWFIRKEKDFSAVEDILIPFCIILAGFLFLDRIKFYFLLALISGLRLYPFLKTVYLTKKTITRDIIVVKSAMFITPTIMALLLIFSVRITPIYIAGCFIIFFASVYNLLLTKKRKSY